MTKYKHAKEAAEILLYFLLAWLFYQGIAFALDTPMPIVSVVSNSMEPIIYKGDLLIVTGGHPHKGDIIIYERPDTRYTIVHRIVNVTDSGYIMKGDNNRCVDTVTGRCNDAPLAVPESRVKGKVRAAMPLLGYPRLLLFSLGI